MMPFWKEFAVNAAVFQVLVELVSFTFDTIKLGSMIVCGLPASPHDPVHESDARRRLLRVLADTANQSVATHDSGCSLFPGLPASHQVCDEALPMKGSGNLVL